MLYNTLSSIVLATGLLSAVRAAPTGLDARQAPPPNSCSPDLTLGVSYNIFVPLNDTVSLGWTPNTNATGWTDMALTPLNATTPPAWNIHPDTTSDVEGDFLIMWKETTSMDPYGCAGSADNSTAIPGDVCSGGELDIDWSIECQSCSMDGSLAEGCQIRSKSSELCAVQLNQTVILSACHADPQSWSISV